MKSTSSSAQICAIFCAIRQTNFSDSITHGPRINAGRFPAIVTDPIFSGLGFTKERMNQESKKKRKRISLRFLLSYVLINLSFYKIDDSKRHVEPDKEKKGDPVQFQEVK